MDDIIKFHVNLHENQLPYLPDLNFIGVIWLIIKYELDSGPYIALEKMEKQAIKS